MDKDFAKMLPEDGCGCKEMKSGDYARGWCDAAPEGNFEGSLEPEKWTQAGNGDMVQKKTGTMHPGQLEADGYTAVHGEMDEYGFVRRPVHRYDVERY